VSSSIIVNTKRLEALRVPTTPTKQTTPEPLYFKETKVERDLRKIRAMGEKLKVLEVTNKMGYFWSKKQFHP